MSFLEFAFYWLIVFPLLGLAMWLIFMPIWWFLDWITRGRVD